MGFETFPKVKNEQAQTSPKNRQEVILDIERKLNIEYSSEEKEAFDSWLENLPQSSAEKPLSIRDIKEATGLLPKAGNYRGDKINIFLTKDNFTLEELYSVFEDFSSTNPNFEISLVKNNDKLISIGIGDKLRNRSTTLDGEYFGHYHPTQFALENTEVLPGCFVAGLLPSAGDVKGFKKYAESVKNGTRIFSKNGFILIKPVEENSSGADDLENFSEKYFNLFAGENKFEFKTDEEVANYFKQKLGFEIEFHYS